MTKDAFTNQAGAELAFALSMGWDDWTWDEESEEGMVRGYRVRWSPDPGVGLMVDDEGDDEALYVLVTGESPCFTIHGYITVAEAREQGKRIGGG